MTSRANTFGRLASGLDAQWDPWMAYHLAIQGMTRSGKSVLCYDLLSALAGRPDVIVCGVDPSGLLLNPWRNGPGDRWIHLGGRNLHRSIQVLADLVDEMDTRIEVLLASDRDKVDQVPGAPPVVIVAMEDYPGYLRALTTHDATSGVKAVERLEPRARAYVGRLIQEGAKAAIRVMLLAQRMDAAIVGGSERSNFGLRITLRMDKREAVEMLHPVVSPDLLERVYQFAPGVGLLYQAGQPLTLFRADSIDYPTYLHRVRRFYPQREVLS